MTDIRQRMQYGQHIETRVVCLCFPKQNLISQYYKKYINYLSWIKNYFNYFTSASAIWWCSVKDQFSIRSLSAYIIYHNELVVEDTTETEKSASYFRNRQRRNIFKKYYNKPNEVTSLFYYSIYSSSIEQLV